MSQSVSPHGTQSASPHDTQPASSLAVSQSALPHAHDTHPTVLPIVLPPARQYRGLSAIGDYWIIAAAAAAAVGAWFAWSWPWWLGAFAIAIALATRIPLLLVAGLVVLSAGVASSQLAGLDLTGNSADATPGATAAADSASFALAGDAIIVADPEWRRGALVTQARMSDSGKRWEVWARGPAAYQFEDALVGQRWYVAGSATAAGENSGRYLWPRHLVGRIQLEQVRFEEAGGSAFRFANSVRGLVSGSAKSLSQRDQALLTGFVYGDDRDQLPEVLHDFRATSLTHLLAVSGSNVAFVLLLVAPLLVRLKLWWRLFAVAALLAEFALLTRAEPSVLRACVLATLAVGAQAVGRRASAKRLLALAVIVLAVADPLLVHAAGFQLSVAAAAGIVLGARPIEARLRGPRWLRLALAVTLAAQLGVLPVQLWLFGSLPLVSIPANVLAGPMAGPAMVWGLLAGVVGGLAGDAVAAFLHLPTKLMVGWVALVARHGAALHWPALEPRELVPLAGVVGSAFVARSWVTQRLVSRSPAVRSAGQAAAQPSVAQSSAAQSSVARLRFLRLAIVPAALVGVWLVADLHRPEFAGTTHLQVITAPQAAQANNQARDFTAVIVDRPDPAWVLDRLATTGTGKARGELDLVVALSTSRSGREAVRAIQSRYQIAELWTPPGFGTIYTGSGNPGSASAAPTTKRRIIREPTPLSALLAGATGVIEPSGDNRLTLV